MDKGHAFTSTLGLTILVISLLLLALNLNLLQLQYVSRDNIKAQRFYHAESGLTEWLHEAGSDYGPLSASLSETHRRLSCGDSVYFTARPWGIFQRISSRAAGESSGIRATIGYSSDPHFSASLIVPPQAQGLIVCEDTRIRGDVICGPRGVRAERLRGVPYWGDRAVFGNVTQSTQDHRPKIDRQKIRELITYYADGEAEWPRETLHARQTGSTDELELPDPSVLYEADLSRSGDVALTITGPGKLYVSDPLFFQRRLVVRNEVEIIIAEPCVIGELVEMHNVILFSEYAIILESLTATQLQVISLGGIKVRNHARLLENSALLCIPDEEGMEIQLENGVYLEGSICLVSNEENLPEWENRILIPQGCSVSGLVFSDRLLELSGEIDGCTITERFHFYQSPTHYYNWIRNATIQRTVSQLPGIPLIFDLRRSDLQVIYREKS